MSLYAPAAKQLVYPASTMQGPISTDGGMVQLYEPSLESSEELLARPLSLFPVVSETLEGYTSRRTLEPEGAFEESHFTFMASPRFTVFPAVGASNSIEGALACPLLDRYGGEHGAAALKPSGVGVGRGVCMRSAPLRWINIARSHLHGSRLAVPEIDLIRTCSLRTESNRQRCCARGGCGGGKSYLRRRCGRRGAATCAPYPEELARLGTHDSPAGGLGRAIGNNADPGL